MSKMVRIDEKTANYLKYLKGLKGSSSLSQLVDELVVSELMKTHALISNGYFAKVGSVVSTESGNPLVIERVSGSFVEFTDGTSLVNGGTVCRNLCLVSKDISSYEGGFKDVR